MDVVERFGPRTVKSYDHDPYFITAIVILAIINIGLCSSFSLCFVFGYWYREWTDSVCKNTSYNAYYRTNGYNKDYDGQGNYDAKYAQGYQEDEDEFGPMKTSRVGDKSVTSEYKSKTASAVKGQSKGGAARAKQKRGKKKK